jgi:hypothetical protein
LKVFWSGSGSRLAIDLPDIRSRRAINCNTTWLHGLRNLADQFNLQQAVVKRGALDLDIVRQIEMPLERPRRNSLVQEFALLCFSLAAFTVSTLCSAVIAISSAEKPATASEIW